MSSSNDEIIAQLLDGSVEFNEVHLEQMPQEDLLVLIQALRGHVLQLTTLVGELSDQIKIIDAFARPKTRRFYYAPGRERTIH